MVEHFGTVDGYIASRPDEVQTILRNPTADPGGRARSRNRIPYGIPTITLDGHCVVYFAAWKRHISVYPVPDGDEDFEREIAPFRAAKGT